MARPQKTGLDYFPLDVDIANDEKVEYLEAKFGVEGFGVLIHLLAAIYREGYYINWGEMQAYVTSKRVNLPVNTTSAIVSQLVNTGFFDRNLYEKYKILTSHGIQTRYLQACEYRKQVLFVNTFCLLTDEEVGKSARIKLIPPPKNVSQVENSIKQEGNADISGLNDGLPAGKIPKVKESKEYIDDDDMRARARKESVSSPSSIKTDEASQRVYTIFSNNIHPITGEIEAQALGDALDHYGEEWVTEAIKKAALTHGMSVSYIIAILKQWEEDGFKSERKKKGARTDGRNARDGHQQNRGKCETEGLRKLKEDMRWADEHQVCPWDVQPAAGGAGSAQK